MIRSNKGLLLVNERHKGPLLASRLLTQRKDLEPKPKASFNAQTKPPPITTRGAVSELLTRPDSPAAILPKIGKNHSKPKSLFSKAITAVLVPVTKTEKTVEEIDFLKQSFRNHFVLIDLKLNQLEHLAQKMQYFENSSNSDAVIHTQGEEADTFYIIDKGTAEVVVDGIKKTELERGRGFGEMSLLYNQKSNKTVIAKPKSGFWMINRQDFRDVVSRDVENELEKKLSFVGKADIFSALTKDQIQEIANSGEIKEYSKGTAVYSQDEEASAFYIIMEGIVALMTGSYEIKKLVKGDWFGEEALYEDTKRRYTAKCIGTNQVKCIEISRSRLQNVIGPSLELMVYRNIQIKAIKNSAIGPHLTPLQIEKIADLLEIKQYKDGEVVVRKGSMAGMKLFIVLEGEYVRKKNSESIVAYKGTLFGAGYLVSGTVLKYIDDDYIMEGQGLLSEISSLELMKNLGGPIEDVSLTNQKSHEKALKPGYLRKARIDKAIDSFTLKDFYYYKTLGAGGFSRVYLVRQHNHKTFFALKCISKEQIIKDKSQDLIIEEKEVLETVNYPFIVNFIRTFKDSRFCYFLEEYLKGVELSTVVRNLGLLTPDQARFYIGCYILSIEYLHSNNIIYRDLKPSNTIVEQNGYPRLVDMGVAKILKGKANRTFTFVGTPLFIAPEIIQGRGYDKSVDLWAIGVCLYRFITGKHPFTSSSNDPKEIYEKIIKQPLTIPENVDSASKRILAQLLNKQPEARLGGSYNYLKNHEWFAVKPPFIPDKTILISDEEIIQMNEDSIPVLEKIKTDYSESNRSKERTRSAVKKDVDSRDSRDFRDNDDDDDDDNDKDKDEDESEPWDKYF